MKQLLPILLFLMALQSCKPEPKVYENYESEILKIEKLNDHVFIHTSYLEAESFGTVSCNGMVYLNGNEAIIFDTPTSNPASAELVDWIGDKNIKGLVVTHFHVDCLGGLDEMHSRDIKSYSTLRTVKLATENKETVLPQIGFDQEMKFTIGGESVLAKFIGEGHTKDNIIGYIPSQKTMFGGCLIKHMKAGKGNLNDANTAAWSMTLEKIKNEFTELETVIPGHGAIGGPELLDFTIDLFNEYKESYVFFLHNRFLETHELEEEHPEFGRVHYPEIIQEFESKGLKVISEKRQGNVNAEDYAEGIVDQIDSLLKLGVAPKNISVIGTSKGGYIAQYVSSLARNPELNFVFIASFQNEDIQNIPEINYCGNILNIYEKSDPFGVSALERKTTSTCEIENFKEIELTTGMGHGFLFKPLKGWMEPTIQWAKGNYELK